MTEQQLSESRPAQTNGKSVAALVLGILSIAVPYIGFILGIIAIVLGNRARHVIDQNGESGRGLAVAGFVCGIVGLCLWGLIILLIIIGLATFMSTATIPGAFS